MSFAVNQCQQISIWDHTGSLTERELRFLKKTWAVPFSEVVFPAINEVPYEVLYSKVNSRPNTPVNIIIGALLLKELNGLTDEGIMNALMFDIRYQIALHTTSFEEQPISDRTLSRFRERCLAYQLETGIDLIHNTMVELGDAISKIVQADRSLLRMDSLMVESNIRRLSRLELIYRCAKKTMKEYQGNDIPAELNHYFDKNDYNQTFYHNDACEETIIKDAYDVLNFAITQGTDAPGLLSRVLNEQTAITETGYRLADKDSLHSQILQSPYDTDATFRRKLRDDHVGYSANVVECCGETTTVILDYQYEKNIYHDSSFLKDTVQKLGPQECETTLVTDGGYCGHENTDLAKKHNIRLITTNLTGRKPADYIAYRKTDEFCSMSRYRNGVEAIPSLLRRKYRVDSMPVRGLLPTRLFFGLKIGAINISKLCIYLQRSGWCAQKKVTGC